MAHHSFIHIASDDEMEQYLEGSDGSPFEVLSRHVFRFRKTMNSFKISDVTADSKRGPPPPRPK
jgi:hypothetical protein